MTDLRALDREIATKVMGCDVRLERCGPDDDPWYRPHCACGGAWGRSHARQPETEREHYFGASVLAEYSSDPSAMMQVIQKMREKGWDVAMSTMLVVGQWHVAFVTDDELVDAEALTLPEAVGRAALAAVGIMEKG